jgi:uncharacterized protein (TIGR02246 family)
MVQLPLASLAALLLLASTLIGCRTRAGLSSADRAAIQALDSAYVNAWLRDDTAAVLATLAPDAVLMPAGVGPLEGHEAIRRFWWPTDGSRTRVTAYRSTVDEIDGSDDLAYVRGTGDMTFIYEKDTVRTEQTSRSMMLTVVARQPDGRWLIRRRMWGNVAR